MRDLLSGRVMAALFALVIGGAGVAVLVRYVQTSEQRSLAGYELVETYIVDEPIPAGTPAAEIGAQVSIDEVPLVSRPIDAVNDLTQLADLVATVDLVPGEQLLASRFDRPDDVRTVFGGTTEVPPGFLEVTIQAASERVVGGQVSPGDVVALFGSFEAFQADDDQVSGLLLRKALVTNVQASTADIFDQADEDGRSRSAPTVELLITVAVSPVDATRIVFASEYGNVWLARDTVLASEALTPSISIDSVFDEGVTSATPPATDQDEVEDGAVDEKPSDLAFEDEGTASDASTDGAEEIVQSEEPSE